MAMIVCIDCGKFFHPFKNGVVFEEGMPINTYERHQAIMKGEIPVEEEWGSYKLWRSDELECPKCGKHILGGVPQSHYHEHYLPGYKEHRQELLDAKMLRVFVKDCI